MKRKQRVAADEEKRRGRRAPAQRRSTRDIPLREKVASTDTIDDEPEGFELVRAMTSTIGVAATGHIPGEDIDEARMRLHDAQVALVALGYDAVGSSAHSPEIEGVWGPETSEALVAFQRDQDLPETGQLDAETYEALMAAYEGAVGDETRGVDEDWEESPYGYRTSKS